MDPSGSASTAAGSGFGSFATGQGAARSPPRDVPGTRPPVAPGPPEQPDDAASVADAGFRPGSANINGGLVRRKKRAIVGVKIANPDGAVAKNYRTTDAVLFNNVSELFQDTISREYAQEIIEDFFDKCGVDTADPNEAKYAEDALFSFLIATTASNKADYDRQIPVPTKGGASKELDFMLFSNLLASTYGVTRRNFSCGVADDQRRFLRRPENTHLLPLLATRIGCDPQFADLAFDGSTHCTGLTSRQIAFTKTLKARNLFESDEVLAAGASDRLMQGIPAGVRSVVPR
jgi:hypothetical protein